MVLNAYGQIAHKEWLNLPDRFPNFEMDVFQIMPNHMHGIISLREKSVGAGDHAGAGLAPALINTDESAQNDGQRKFIIKKSNNIHGSTNVHTGQPHIDIEHPNSISKKSNTKHRSTSVHTGQPHCGGYINRWRPLNVYIFLNRIMKQWENCGNAIIMNASYGMKNLIRIF